MGPDLPRELGRRVKRTTGGDGAAETLRSGQGQPLVGEMATMKETSDDGVAKRVLMNRSLWSLIYNC